MTELRLATRPSPLAMAQTRLVVEALASHGIGAAVVPVETTGDRDRISPVATLTEVGAFVRSVQRAVLDGRADVAVHSGKDLPVEGPPELRPFHPRRGSPFDSLCGHSLDGLPQGATVGTGSPRRAAQLRRIRPDVSVAEIRGNVGTRLRAVDEGMVAAVVLAQAGLDRVGRPDAAHHRFDVAEMVPAPAQGALTLECRAGGRVAEALALVQHHETIRELAVERGLLAATGAGCRSALGCLARALPDGSLEAHAFVEDERGPRLARVVGDEPVGVVDALRSELEV
jgi:hydroxymethylbilane synthase